MPEIATQPTPPAENRKIHRAVMEALFVCFNDEAKRYDKGYTDQRVADETGASVVFVRKTREDYFGPLAVPVEFQAVSQDLDSLMASIATTRRDMATIKATFDSRHAELIAAAGKIEAKLNGIAEKNGWK